MSWCKWASGGWRTAVVAVAALAVYASAGRAQEAEYGPTARRLSRPQGPVIPLEPIEWETAAPAVAVREFGFTPLHEELATRGNIAPSPANAPELIDDGGWMPEMCDGEMGSGLAPVCDDPYDADSWLVNMDVIWQRHALEVAAGVQGFTGPANRGSSGSFGFHEAVNFGAALPFWGCRDIGWQIGARATQSNFSGTSFSPDGRYQTFATAGLFHRVDRGLQWAVAFDWLHESWYHELDLRQVRGEVSWKATCWHEVGFMFATGNDTQTVTFTPRPPATTALTDTYTTTDWYAIYCRRRFGACDDGEARLFGGWTGVGDGIVGADIRAPLFDDWSMVAGFTFLLPHLDSPFGTNASYAQEVWNAGLSLVWSPGSGKPGNYFRPLLGVADNGSLLIAQP